MRYSGWQMLPNYCIAGNLGRNQIWLFDPKILANLSLVVQYTNDIYYGQIHDIVRSFGEASFGQLPRKIRIFW